MDASSGDHWSDLADSLSGDSHQLWLCVRSGVPKKAAVEGGIALCHQSGGEPDLHADPVRDAKPAVGGGGHSDRLGHHHLDDDRRLAALSLGHSGSSAVFCLGITGNGAAIVDHGDELEEAVMTNFHFTENPVVD